MIDLAGISRGLVFAVGGVSVSQPWLLGGTRGSENLAAKSLSTVPCLLLDSAWILRGSNVRLQVSDEVLIRVGLEPTSTEQGDVGHGTSVWLPLILGGFHEARIVRPPHRFTGRSLEEADGRVSATGSG